MRVYHVVLVCISETRMLIAVWQGPAGTSASVPVPALANRMSHSRIRIPKTFCPLHAIGHVMNRTRLPDAWPQGCAPFQQAGSFPPGLSSLLGGPAPASGLRWQAPTACSCRLPGVHSALDRLVDMPDVGCPLQLFSDVLIGHRDWRGEQTVHAMPFGKEKIHMVTVCVCIHMYFACIYMYIVCMCMYSVCIRLYLCR